VHPQHEQRVERRLAAIFAADVAGYSRLMSQDEAGTLRALGAAREIMDSLIAQQGGRIANTAGDSVLAEFPSAVDAVQCAVAVQEKLAEANAGVAEDRRLQFRIGIHLGDVAVRGGDLLGDGVNIAARLEGMAQPGGVCLSGAVHGFVRKALPLAYTDLGEQRVRNIDEPVQVYALMPAPVPPSQPSDGQPKALSLPDRPSVAVLPFKNVSGDAEENYLSDGITEEIITGLARFRSLFVIARNSSFAFRDDSTDVAEVGRRLGVSHLVEGRVRRFGERLRISAKLIEATTSAHVWAGHYDRKLEDLFAVQDEVAQMIVSTLVGTLEHTRLEQAFRRPTDSIVAYDFLLRGLAYFRGYAEKDNQRACEMFEQAVARDPRFGLAHAYLAFGRVALNGYASAPSEILACSFRRAVHGVDLDPQESRCYRSLGMICLYRRDYDAAERHLARALDLNPNDADGKSQLGYLLALRGKPEEGLEWMAIARRLNPLHPIWYDFSAGIALYSLRRYEEAAQAFKRLPNPGVWARARLAACLAQVGRSAEAQAEAIAILSIRPEFSIQQFMESDVLLERIDDREHLWEGLRRAELPR
jgi:adenylate cyclase